MSGDVLSGTTPKQGAILGYEAFFARANESIRARGAELCAVLMVEVDQLASLDSSLGFIVTDALLRDIGARLVDALRPTDAVGKIGRLRLACLLDSLPSQSHAILAANKVVRSLAEPFRVDGRTFFLNTYVGIGLNDAGCDTGDELLRRAAHAVKEGRRHQEPYSVYHEQEDALALLHFDLQGDLKQAIERNDLFLCYQPKLDLSSERIFSAEALVRWRHPEKGMIPAGRLIEVAEQTGMISSVTQWVINTALRECADYRRRGLDVGISINFSAHNLREQEIVTLVGQAVQLWGVPPEQIVIELTETAVMDDQPQAKDTLQELKDLGVQLSMDDFGSGYSSMSRLRDLSLDELKIDMSFVRNMLKAPVHERIVQSMISLAHGLNLSVVAEGVEDAVTMEHLRSMGCDCIQGYLIGKPVPLVEFIELVKSFGR